MALSKMKKRVLNVRGYQGKEREPLESVAWLETEVFLASLSFTQRSASLKEILIYDLPKTSSTQDAIWP